MSGRIKLKVIKGHGEYRRQFKLHYTTCSPFIENKLAMLIHRPVSMILHKNIGHHLAIHYACGLTACGSDKFGFLYNLNENHIVCEKCEEKAIKLGYGSSEEICGHHVHVGKTKAVITCCKVEV